MLRGGAPPRRPRAGWQEEQHSVEIRIFGKTDCAKCEAVKKKVNFFLEKWGVAGQVPVIFVNLDTVEGRADGAFYDVATVPTTVVFDGETEAGRWDGTALESDALRLALGLS